MELSIPAITSLNDNKFISELEFVQNLANVDYLHCEFVCFVSCLFQTQLYDDMITCSNHNYLPVLAVVDLATNGFFEDPRFLNFLYYLKYWYCPSPAA